MRETVVRGNVAELMVAAEISKFGITICLPFSHIAGYDLIIEINEVLKKIQVKRAYMRSNVITPALVIETRRVVRGKLVPYQKGSFDFLIACDVKENNFWIFPYKMISKYKSRIQLGKKMDVYKNNWSIII